LVAYVVFTSGENRSDIHEELNAFLKRKLPDYMMPSAIVVLEKLPLTVNGKIDRQALPSAEPRVAAYRAPRAPEEEILCGIYADLLSLDYVGIDDSFFSLGGHSLLAMRLVNQVRRAFGVELSVRTVFEAPSVAGLVSHVSRAGKASLPLVRQERPARLPVSFAQQRLWFLDRLEGSSAEYNMPQALRLRGELDVAALERAIHALVERHEIFRTHFAEHEGEPYQIVEPDVRIVPEVQDFSGLREDLRQEAIESRLQRESQQPFDLSKGPLLRTGLLKLGPQDHILHWSCHHAIFDGWSAGVFGAELSTLYASFCEGCPAKLPELPVQYADYALWQRRRMEEGEFERLLAYWRDQLSELPVLELPTDRPRGSSPNFEGGAETLLLPESLCKELRSLSSEEAASMAMLLLAAFELLLGRLSDQDDVAVGFPIAGRSCSESEGLIGLFVNTLVLRAKLDGSLTFRQLLAQVRKSALEAYSHQEMPFERLVEELNPERLLNRHPLFEVLFNYISISRGSLNLPGVSLEPVRLQGFQAKFPMSLYLEEISRSLMLRLAYQTALFRPERIARIVNQFHYLLTQIAENPDRSIYAYSLATETDRKVLPDPTISLPEPKQVPITLRFLEIAKLHADDIALRHDTREWTYQELAESSRQIAASLAVHGIQPGDVVAATGSRSFGLIAGILGVLLARGVLLTLDLSLPIARRDLMLQVAKCKHWLSVRNPKDANEEETGALQFLPVTRVSIEGTLVDGCDLASAPTFSRDAQPDDPAYIFFTSGTTGIPKGILGTHKSLSHFLGWEQSTVRVDLNDRVAQLTGLSFDVVLRDIFLPLTTGATLCLPDTALVSHGHDVVPWMRREQITILHTVPSLAATWLDTLESRARLPDLRWVLMAGEPLTDTLVRRWREQIGNTHTILNLYGPTETTLAKCFYTVPINAGSGVQPIGKPLPNTQALVINKADELCGIGEPGEIVIRTPFRTLGYLSVRDNHRTGFARNPFREDPCDVIYRTGDCGSYSSEGLLSISHRLDDQLKIRGNRVEPAEVSAVLEQYPGIENCAVVTREDVAGEKCLVAYLVQKNGASASVSALRDFLKRKLPEYMLPTGFVMLDKLPLTPNGKLDRKRLPAPGNVPSPAEGRYMAPRDFTERTLANLWSDLLKLGEVGIQDDFFALGGHSLLATRLVSQIRREFGVEISLRAIFENPTIERLALQIAEKRVASIASEEVDELLKDLESLPEEAAECQLSKIEKERSKAFPSAKTDHSVFGS
jgi:amino acid adenylation domain-containing protein